MFSYAKRSYSAVLKVSKANVSLTSAALSFCFQIPFNTLNLLNCKLCLDCGTWVLHVCVIVDIWNLCSSCWKKPECFQLGGLKKKGKKIPLQPKLTSHTKNTHNQLYTTNISYLISVTVSWYTLSFHLHTLTLCVPIRTHSYTHSWFCSKPQIPTENKKTNWGNKSQH